MLPARFHKKYYRGFLLSLASIYILPSTASLAQSPPPASIRPNTATPTVPIAEKADYSGESFVIEKYSTEVTFAADGTGERLITVAVKVQSDAAVRQFGVLEFPYESRNERVDFVYVRVKRADGSVVATPDADAQDQPAEVTRIAPFYSDIRSKQLPVKGLSPGDRLEYQVRYVRTVAAAPGEFWYTQDFVKNAVVLDETIVLNVPRDKYVHVESGAAKPGVSESGDRKTYRWKNTQLEETKAPSDKDKKPSVVEAPPAMAITTFKSWDAVGKWYSDLQRDRVAVTPAIQAKSKELTKDLTGDEEKIAAIYNYVSIQFRYIGVAFGIGRYQPHSADDVLANQYGDCKDKHTLLAALLKAAGYDAWPVLVGTQHALRDEDPSPGQFDHVITAVTLNKSVLWMDSTPEIAPFRMLANGLRDKEVLAMPTNSTAVLMKTPANPPFDSFGTYTATAKLDKEGTLSGHFDIAVRGDDELMYRAGFHNVARVQWPTLVQNISYASGFAGTASNISASNPEQTAKPFEYSYDYSRKEYADWANRRILPLMPPLSFNYSEDDAKPAETIMLGGPVTYTFHASIQLPQGYTAQLPAPVKLETTFEDYSTTYSLKDSSVVIDRVAHVKLREIPVAQWSDYIKLGKAVVADEGTFIQLMGAGANVGAEQTASDPDAANLIQQAYTDIQARNFDAGRQGLDQAAKLNPKQWSLWAEYGYLHISQGRMDEGLRDYQKEIEIHPENFQAYQTLAINQAYFAKRPDDAIRTLRALLKASPDHVNGHMQLSMLLVQQKRFSEAVPILEETVKLAPEDQKMKVMLGSAEISSGAREKGSAMLKDVLGGATDPLVLNNAAYELADADMELPLAHSSCEKALKLLNDSTGKVALSALKDDDLKHTYQLATTWDTMAWILYRQGELDKAEEFARAAWMLGQRAMVGSHLGQICEKRGKKAEAIHLYELALSAGTGLDKSGVEDAEQRLRKLVPGAVSFNAGNARGQELGELRSVRVPKQGKTVGSADFLVLFSPARVEDIQFLHGDEALKPAAALLGKAKFNVPFPPESGARIVRRGVFYCSAAMPECQFTMLLPENASRN